MWIRVGCVDDCVLCGIEWAIRNKLGYMEDSGLYGREWAMWKKWAIWNRLGRVKTVGCVELFGLCG